MRSLSISAPVRRQDHVPHHGTRVASPGFVVGAAICVVLGAAALPGQAVAAAKFSTLYTFQGGSDGGNPYTETLVDRI